MDRKPLYHREQGTEVIDKTNDFGYILVMATIFRQDGFEVMVYTNDHRPAHVHVFKAEGEIVIYLGDTQTPPSVRSNIGMSHRDERKALIITGEHQEEFLEAWRRIHG